jgi:alkanesulfonate monooxygenase SsuD/methylene tetrahydromethanopterin reductase-like flavin-dependent oxidoreductase (luciferase family)
VSAHPAPAIGLFVDLRRLPDSARTAAEHTAWTIDLLAHAESLGCDAAWFTEHHGFPDGYLPQPLVLAAAVAARTSTMRLGTGIALGPLRHPRHLAEEAALVDVISNGRVEIGIGAGYSPQEFEWFGADLSKRFTTTDAAAIEVRRLLASGEVTPGPVQTEVPIWLGYQGPQGAGRAGRAGVGLLSLDPALLEPYRAGLAEAGSDPDAARMGGLIEIVVADDPQQAAARILPHWLHQQNTYRALRGGGPLDADKARSSLERTGRLGGLRVLDVDGAVAALGEAISAVPARHAYTWLSVGDMPAELVERHVELWCGPVRAAVLAASGAAG